MTKKKVLVVDDDIQCIQVVRDYLENKGFSVVTAYNGQEGVQKAKTQSPDLIILDIMMPVMDGMTALKELKKDASTSGVPVIMLTAKGSEEDLIKGYKDGAEYYITKPFELKQLMKGVNLMLEIEE